MLTIALIENISTTAYLLEDDPDWFRLRLGTPTEAYRYAKASRCHAALLPVARLEELHGTYRPLGRFGIACEGPVLSVKLFSNRPLVELLGEQMPIYVTEKTQTSRELLNVLCPAQYGLFPTFTSNSEEARARLLIAEDAVEESNRPWTFQIDLGQWWRQLTGLPFVFAQWVCRSNLENRHRDKLLDWLDGTVERVGTDMGRNAMIDRLSLAGLSPQFASEYLQGLHYRLSELDLKAVQLFHALRTGVGRCVVSA